MIRKIAAALTATAVLAASASAAFAVEINESYDDVRFTNDCEADLSGLVLNGDAPDGTSFYKNEGTAAVSISGLPENTSEDYLWEFDVRFDEEESGVTVRDYSNKKVDTCVRRHNDKLAIQTGKTSYVEYCDINADSWYHIQLIGQFGTEKSLSMEVYEWNNGEKIFIGKYENINKRNNVPAAHFDIEPNTSVDNLQITKLGADELTVSSIPEGVTELSAGSSISLTYQAFREGEEFTSPDTVWKIFENDEEIEDGSVTISDNGVVSAHRSCPDKEVTAKVISTEKGEVTGEYPIKINAVNFDELKYDTLTLEAESEYVTSQEPLKLNVRAYKDGEEITLDDGNVYFAAYDESNIKEIGSRYIRVENNMLTIADNVVPQNIVLRAENASGTVSASLPVRIKPANAVDIGDTGTKDRLLVSDGCENDISAAKTERGSWDGSHYYKFTSAASFNAVEPTSEDFLISTDVKFLEDGGGFMLKGSGKLGGQIALKGQKIGRIGSGGKFVAFCSGDSDSWYHIEVMARCGSASPYGKAYIYKYDEDGNLVHPDTNEIGKCVEGVLDLRTVGGVSFNYAEVQPGTGIDNFTISHIVPDELKVSLSASQIFAGRTTQASVEVLHKGITIGFFPESKLEWKIYDANNENPIDDDYITIDESGLITVSESAPEETVYIRVVSKESGVYSSQMLTIKDSDVFKITGLGTNEEGNVIEEIRVEKNVFYGGDVSFIVAAYGENGELLGIASRSYTDNKLAVGENKVPVKLELPEGFASVKTFIWTSL